MGFFFFYAFLPFLDLREGSVMNGQERSCVLVPLPFSLLPSSVDTRASPFPSFQFFCVCRTCTMSSTHLESPQPCFHHLRLSDTAHMVPSASANARIHRLDEVTIRNDKKWCREPFKSPVCLYTCSLSLSWGTWNNGMSYLLNLPDPNVPYQ